MYLKVIDRLDLKRYHQGKKKVIMWGDGDTN